MCVVCLKYIKPYKLLTYAKQSLKGLQTIFITV